jgi:hypothetical protein
MSSESHFALVANSATAVEVPAIVAAREISTGPRQPTISREIAAKA